jgi:GH18 family chitinase
MWNDDENSPYYLWYISYENALTLQDKLDFIHERGIAGLIVWECANDTYDHIFITQMADNLLDQE